MEYGITIDLEGRIVCPGMQASAWMQPFCHATKCLCPSSCYIPCLPLTTSMNGRAHRRPRPCDGKHGKPPGPPDSTRVSGCCQGFKHPAGNAEAGLHNHPGATRASNHVYPPPPSPLCSNDHNLPFMACGQHPNSPIAAACDALWRANQYTFAIMSVLCRTVGGQIGAWRKP